MKKKERKEGEERRGEGREETGARRLFMCRACLVPTGEEGSYG